MAVSLQYFTGKGYEQCVVDSAEPGGLANRRQFLTCMHCNQHICVFVVQVHVLFGFEAFLLEHCVFLSVKHLKTIMPSLDIIICL